MCRILLLPLEVGAEVIHHEICGLRERANLNVGLSDWMLGDTKVCGQEYRAIYYTYSHFVPVCFYMEVSQKKISLLLGDTCPEMSKENKPSSLRYFSSCHILK